MATKSACCVRLGHIGEPFLKSACPQPKSAWTKSEPLRAVPQILRTWNGGATCTNEPTIEREPLLSDTVFEIFACSITTLTFLGHVTSSVM